MWNYEDIRHLVPHRVQAAQVLEESGVRPNNFDLDAHIAKGEFGLPLVNETLALEAMFTRRTAISLYESPLSEDQTLIEVDAYNILVRATVRDTAELRWRLLGFGDKATARPQAALDAQAAYDAVVNA